ncbi:MAG: hypothetical protein P9X22_03075 [Candidatus Zapsychrus exili]|nr:hypothetical protein [Candidatus Zapsychrus exili]
MSDNNSIFQEVKGLYKILPLESFRQTPGVHFDIIPLDVIPRIDGIDRVIHEGGAISPGSVGEVKRPWYMHTGQEDYLLVLGGTRYTDIYNVEHKQVERFEVAPNYIKKNDKMFYEGAAMLVWPCNVFHRIKSSDDTGSVSINFAVRNEKFDINNNFSIYDVNTDTDKYVVIREGHLDQKN